MNQGTLLIVSGPAGVGKGTVVAAAVEKAKGHIYLVRFITFQYIIKQTSCQI